MKDDNALKFWNWFLENQEKYRNIDKITDSDKEDLLEEFLRRLHLYSPNLYFQIGQVPNSMTSELVITAEGDKRYFSDVECLTDNAPYLDNWKIIAFKQPNPDLKMISYNSVDLDVRQVLFQPLRSKKVNGIGLRFYVDKYKLEKEKEYFFLISQILESLLGEKDAALLIDYWDIRNIDEYGSETNDLIEIKKLKDFLDWKLHLS